MAASIVPKPTRIAIPPDSRATRAQSVRQAYSCTVVEALDVTTPRSESDAALASTPGDPCAGIARRRLSRHVGGGGASTLAGGQGRTSDREGRAGRDGVGGHAGRLHQRADPRAGERTSHQPE